MSRKSWRISLRPRRRRRSALKDWYQKNYNSKEWYCSYLFPDDCVGTPSWGSPVVCINSNWDIYSNLFHTLVARSACCFFASMGVVGVNGVGEDSNNLPPASWEDGHKTTLPVLKLCDVKLQFTSLFSSSMTPMMSFRMSETITLSYSF